MKKLWLSFVCLVGFSHSSFAAMPVPARNMQDFANRQFSLDSTRWPFSPEIFSESVGPNRPWNIYQTLERVVVHSYITKTEKLKLESAKMEMWRRAMEITPHLNANLLASDFGLKSTLESSLKVLVPSEWFGLQSKIERYLGEKYRMQLTLFDQYHAAQLVYFSIGKIQTDLTIYQYYISLIKSLIVDIQLHSSDDNSLEILHLKSVEAKMESIASELVGQWKKNKNQLAYLAGITSNTEDINVVPLHFNDLLQPKNECLILSEKERTGLEKKVLSSSLELKAMRVFYDEKKATYWQQTLNFVKALGLSLGADQYFIEELAFNELNQVLYDYQDLKASLLRRLSDIVANYDSANAIIESSGRGKRDIEQKIKIVLSNYFNRTSMSLSGIHRDLRLALEQDLKLNEGHYLLLGSRIDLDRMTYKHKIGVSILEKQIKNLSHHQE